MRRTFALLLCAALALLVAASAEGLAGLAGSLSTQIGPLPDPAEVSGEPGTLYRENYSFASDLVCDAYVYPVPGDAEDFLARYIPLVEARAYAVTEMVAEGVPAYRIEAPDTGRYALLFPEYQGRMLLLVDTELPFGESAVEETAVPETAVPEAPAPTPDPAAGASSSGGGHLEYVTQQAPCYVCHTSGKCNLCNGTGVYRLYGESVPCDPVCSFCDGLGYIEQIVPQWVPD